MPRKQPRPTGSPAPRRRRGAARPAQEAWRRATAWSAELVISHRHPTIEARALPSTAFAAAHRSPIGIAQEKASEGGNPAQACAVGWPRSARTRETPPVPVPASRSRLLPAIASAVGGFRGLARFLQVMAACRRGSGTDGHRVHIGSSEGRGGPMTERELDRGGGQRLAIIRHAQEVTGNVSKTCRYYGITRQAYYKWLRRYEEHGVGGPAGPRDGPRRARTRPAGRGGRQDRLPAPDLPLRAAQDRDVPQALPRPPGHTVRDLADPQAPGHEPAADVAAVPPPRRPVEALREAATRAPGPDRRQVHRAAAGLRKKHYQFTAIDDCTRIRVLRIYDRLNQKTAIRFLDYVLEKLPFPVEVIQTDNGAEFQAQFHYHVLDRGIGHVYIKPATPRLNGKVERSHRIDHEEFYRMLDGRRDRRHRAVQRPAPGVGGLLQLPPAARRPRWPDAV